MVRIQPQNTLSWESHLGYTVMYFCHYIWQKCVRLNVVICGICERYVGYVAAYLKYLTHDATQCLRKTWPPLEMPQQRTGVPDVQRINLASFLRSTGRPSHLDSQWCFWHHRKYLTTVNSFDNSQKQEYLTRVDSPSSPPFVKLLALVYIASSIAIWLVFCQIFSLLNCFWLIFIVVFQIVLLIILLTLF